MKLVFQSSLIFLSILLLSSARCKKESDHCHTHIKTINNSDKTIYIDGTGSNYPDTIFSGPTPVNNPQWTKAEAHRTNNSTLSIPGACYEEKMGASDTFSIYVFDAETLNNIPWDVVKAKSLYLKRHDLTLQQLKDMSWTIIYP